MNTHQHPSGAGGEQVSSRPGPGRDETAACLRGFEARLLAELQAVVAERAEPTGPGTGLAGQPGRDDRRFRPAGRGPAGRAWPARRLALTGVVAAATAALVVTALTLTGAHRTAQHFAAPTSAVA
ncbi:MAG: hypothetical protein J2P35_22350, partial [Actinobacteria bacterium]|nr:hypothetical protein [Actinomycetota bacterium]